MRRCFPAPLWSAVLKSVAVAAALIVIQMIFAIALSVLFYGS
jgi:hypothetical protein